MTYIVKGTCSECGGRVLVPSVWMGVTPPVATCESCGATEVTHGPVIQMQKQQAPLQQLVTWAQHAAPTQFNSWLSCEHANECPTVCGCPQNCACREKMCR